MNATPIDVCNAVYPGTHYAVALDSERIRVHTSVYWVVEEEVHHPVYASIREEFDS